ncbi:DNA mismatch repair protein MSH4-like isoform X3 [Carica papaya]|uniref:DNA mismatch repair protein MSH4-like isoform X3 n=1 Tax=Carica papaya TaxID=3649 RepID=UPI000B8C9C2A|nr:DNA mismatch repair protein MSH4-like isoform X3 [Carica papaya]
MLLPPLKAISKIFLLSGKVIPSLLLFGSVKFMTEMKETAFIMQNVSNRSLIVMDELGMATSSSDGFSIAWSCCERLLSLKA